MRFEVMEQDNPLQIPKFRFVAVAADGEAEGICGYGATPEEAINNLREFLEDE